MTIKAKILSLVAAFALLALAITGLSLKTMSDYNHSIETYRQATEDAFRGERLNRYVMASALEMRGIYMSRTDEDARVAANMVDMRANILAQFINDWKAQVRPQDLPEFNEVYANATIFIRGNHAVAKIAREQSLKAASDFGNHAKYRIFREQMQARIDAMVSRIETHQMESLAKLKRFETERQIQFMLIAISGTLLLLVGSMWIAIGSISEPLNRVRQSMVQISEGAYDTPIPTGTMSNEIGQLWKALDILKAHAMEAERLSREQIEQEHKLRELVLD